MNSSLHGISRMGQVIKIKIVIQLVGFIQSSSLSLSLSRYSWFQYYITYV